LPTQVKFVGATMRLKRRSWMVLTALTGLLVGGLVYYRARPAVFNESFWEHAHCIAQANIALRSYAETNGGRFPHHPKGYPHALLLLPADSPWYALTGPGYRGDVLARARRSGLPLSEQACGRVYVQGLTLRSNGELVLLFDRLPTPGGDHCHFPQRLWAPYGREVLRTDGSHNFVGETEWPGFARRQVELLSREGIPRTEAERLYGLASE
jgi:hypothetical protein